jgi:sulfate adenylyltransferase
VTSVVLEGRELDLLTLAVLGALPGRVEIPGYALRPRVNASAEVGEVVQLLDPEGAPLATLTVEEVTAASEGGTWLSGPLGGLRPVECAGPLVFVGGPLTSAQVLELGGGAVTLVPLVGHGRRGRLTSQALVRSCRALLPGLGVGSSVLPLPVPGSSPALEDELLGAIAASLGVSRLRLGADDGSFPPAVQAELDRPRGLVVQLTGLSGSGKSTLARALRDRLVEGGRDVTLLDGDVVRRLLSQDLGFSAEDRDLNVRRIGYVAAEVARHGGLAIAAPIAPYARSRSAVRSMVEEAGGTYLLVHVSTPLDVCEARDRKGLYARARRGEISSFTGISDPYEVPDDADLVLDTSTLSIDDALTPLLHEVVSRFVERA